MSTNGDASRGGGSVSERLRAFMHAHDLGLEELADFLGTPPEILALWFSGRTVAPACSLISLPLAGRMTQARAYRSDSKEEALRRVQAI